MLHSSKIESVVEEIIVRLRIFQSPLIILLFIILVFATFLSISSFEHAMTPEEAAALGYPLMPSDWEAGVRNHGEYYRWFKIENHPFFYYGSYATLFISWLDLSLAAISIMLDMKIISSETRKEKRRKMGKL